MVRWLLCFAAFLLTSNGLFAQGVITGTVVDKNSKQPIEFASVTVMKLKDSVAGLGAATDKNGKFSLSDVGPGDYFLRISFIGYDNLQTPVFSILPNTSKYNLGKIELETGAKSLSEVTVTGKNQTLNTSIDRKSYNVAQDIMSRSGSVADILKNIPSVEVDIEGAVSLRGSANVMILINGKPSPLMGRSRAEVLQQLPANSIERIEVITNPSARFRPDGTSGIINIVLKKNIRNGFNGSTTLNAGNNDRYNGNIALNYHPKKWNLFSNYSIRQDRRMRINTVDRSNVTGNNNGATAYYNQATRSLARPVSNVLNGGIDYTLNEHNSLGISGNYYIRKQIKNDVTENLSFNKEKVLVQEYSRTRIDPELEKQREGTAYFQHTFRKEDHELRIEFNTSKADEVEDNHYTNTYRLPQRPTSKDNTLIKPGEHQSGLTIDYTNPLSESSKLEAGYDGSYNKIDLNFYGEYYDAAQNNFRKDLEKSNQFIYDQTLHAIYVTYEKSFKKFGYSAGLRAEQAATSSHLVNLDSFVTNNYFKVYPTLHLSYKLTEDKEVQLNYSKRVNRPEGDELNPFPEYQDPRNIRAGNPKLLPEIIHSVEGGYQWKNKYFSFVPSLYYRYKQNGFTSVVIPLNDTTLLTTTQNLASDQAAGLELILSAKTNKIFSANLSSNFFYNRIDATNLGYINNRSIVSMTTNLNTTLTITKATMLQVSANYRSARLTPQGKTFPTFVMNAGVRQDFLKNKLSVVLTASNLLNTLKQKTILDTPYLHQTAISRRDGRILYAGINYRFGVLKKVKEEKLQFDNSL